MKFYHLASVFLVLLLTPTLYAMDPTRMQVSVDRKYAHLLTILQNQGINLNVHYCDSEPDQVLHVAAGRNNPKAIDFLLANNIPVNETDINQTTALMLAAQCGHWIAALALLKNKAPVNAMDISGKTALMYAAKSGACDIDTADAIRVLRFYGADVNIRDKNKKTALDHATKCRKKSTAVPDALTEDLEKVKNRVEELIKIYEEKIK